MAMPLCGEKPVDAGPIDGVAAMGSAAAEQQRQSRGDHHQGEHAEQH